MAAASALTVRCFIGSHRGSRRFVLRRGEQLTRGLGDVAFQPAGHRRGLGVAPDDAVREVDGRTQDRIACTGVGAAAQGTGHAAQFGLEPRVHRGPAFSEVRVRARVKEVLRAERKQQLGVVTAGAGERHDRDGHCHARLERIWVACGLEVARLETLERAQPSGAKDAVAVAEAVVERPGRGAAGAGDRGDADGARPVRHRQRPCGVQDAVTVVLPRRCHSNLVRSFYMERLPYIDEHIRCVGATRERTWARPFRVASMLVRRLLRRIQGRTCAA
jgi:hypothetical protein